MKIISRLMFILIVGLLINISSVFAIPDETDGCIFVANGGAYGTYEFTWTFSTNGVINDYTGLAGPDVHFKAGDTVKVEILDGYQAATSNAVLSIDPLGATVSSPIPGSMSYTFAEDTIASARLGGDWGSLSPPHGTMLLKFRFTCVSGEYGSNDETYSGPPDSRLNWQSGDANIAVLYPTGEEISVYLYETDTYIYNFVTNSSLVSRH